MSALTQAASHPWLCLGDLNAIVSPLENQGGRRFCPSSSAGLSTFLESSGAIDLGFVGSSFTWDNGRLGFACIQERLDRCIVSIDWRLR